MDVLVTGATGFTGYHVVARLRDAGHRVRALVRDIEKGRRLLTPLGVAESDFVVGDMTDPDAVSRALEGCDAVVHAAAAVSVRAPGTTDDIFEANVVGARTVIGGACERGVASVVFVSSLTAIFDHRSARTTAESPLVESATRYGRSKADSDAFARSLQEEGKTIAIVYPSAIIGPDDPGRSESMSAYRGFLQTMIDSDGGSQFVDVRDLAQLIERLLATRANGGFIAAGEFFTWRGLTECIEGVTGASIRRMRAPGWVLRGAGSVADLAGRVTGRALPMSREAMEVATRWRHIEDSKEITEMGVQWRPSEETLRDVYSWFLARGAINPQFVPKLVVEGKSVG